MSFKYIFSKTGSLEWLLRHIFFKALTSGSDPLIMFRVSDLKSLHSEGKSGTHSVSSARTLSSLKEKVVNFSQMRQCQLFASAKTLLGIWNFPPSRLLVPFAGKCFIQQYLHVARLLVQNRIQVTAIIRFQIHSRSGSSVVFHFHTLNY